MNQVVVSVVLVAPVLRPQDALLAEEIHEEALHGAGELLHAHVVQVAQEILRLKG